jgi:hypothetical protein
LLPSQLPRDVSGKVAVQVRNNPKSSSEQETTPNHQSSSKKRSVAVPKWGKNFTRVSPTDVSNVILAREEHMKQDVRDKTPYELFKLYYDDEVQNLIITESVKYARQKNNTSLTKAILTFSSVLYYSLAITPCPGKECIGVEMKTSKYRTCRQR